jgi:hypothetical protein
MEPLVEEPLYPKTNRLQQNDQQNPGGEGKEVAE